VDDEVELFFEGEDDALGHPADAEDAPSRDGREGGVERANEERIADPNALEDIARDARRDALYIELDVR